MIIHIKEIPFGSGYYQKSLLLRNKILRKPLGLTLSEKDLDAEDKQFHFVALMKNELVGCVVLKIVGTKKIKLRQMAVDSQYQGNNIGTRLIEYVIEHAKSLGFFIVECHARISAMAFYQKMDFETIGAPFVEVTEPHIKMIKYL